MARMYPKKLSGRQRKKNPAEADVFDELKDAQGTEGWKVFHSVRLPGRWPKVYPEIDFVVVIPGKGVICLEVKDGRRIYLKDTKWYRDGNPFPENPFDQVEEATRILLERLGKEFKPECAIGHMVVFPNGKCAKSPRFHSWEVIDRDGMERMSSLILKGIRNWCQDRLKKREYMSSGEEKKIINFLKLCFNSDRVEKKNIWIRESEDELLKLTQEQYKALKFFEVNPHCFFQGAAGTGKTMLAVKAALNASEEGKNVLLVCYNKLLSQWLLEQTKKHANITTGTLHGVVENLIEKTTLRDEFHEKKQKCKDEEKLYNGIYPEYGQLALDKEELGSPQFDLIVMDEAQDLIFKEKILDFLNDVVHGGLSNGLWAFFGDFSRQNIYSDKQRDPLPVLKSYCEEVARYPESLMINCRNTKNIAEATYLLSELEDPPSMHERDDGLEVDYNNYWRNYNNLVVLLEAKIKHLHQQEEIPLEDIVILTSSINLLEEVKKIEEFSLEDISSSNLNAGKRKKAVKCSTIHSFKGLESSAIIVVGGKEMVFGDNSKSLLYVSMSRAKSLLVMMIDNRARKGMEALRRNSPSN